ncbi:MAG TPA: phosphoglucosamine mutase [Spirochaetota bacterium]|nr:phosphoglucosamine mutase [Spirochaetota bacterium]HPW51730.1 phosphoglucosamine mutase [Spirochaetota bacterium]HQO21892.1 phosphoglucosamine mutase [Spirochaetota bacterium]HQQ23747.1 phosphoglucosamine mutase [Spirochaetota bacterium]
MSLMMSVSGIRGIVGETFTPELIEKVSSRLAKYLKGGTVVIGRDSRHTGEAVMRLAESTLVLSGCDVVDIGIVPTPTVQIMVEKLKAKAGIVISASHNPIEWNAFKLINEKGEFFSPKQIREFFELLDKDMKYPVHSKIGKLYYDDTAFASHLDMVLSKVDTARIKKRKFKVALDSVNGAGSYITQELLKRLGCTVVPVFCSIDGNFPRVAEPLAENLKVLCASVKKNKADIGFAQDPDADRLAIVDETGRAIGEEMTLVITADYILSRKKGNVVVNMSTSRGVQDIASRHGSKFFRSKVGEINVVEEMKKQKAVFGGEGNGGVISPEAHYGRDSLVGIAYVLDYLARKEEKLSSVLTSLPSYVMKKSKVKFDPSKVSDLVSAVKKEFAAEIISTLDGIRVDFKYHTEFRGGWVHLRGSNTEPVFRIISEGTDKYQAEKIQKYFEKLISSIA